MKKQTTPTSLKQALLLIALISTTISYSQVGINTTTPANGAILDIDSDEKGVFIPRMNILDLTTIAPVTGITGPVEELAAQGLLVYNTFVGTGTGFYFWNGTDWAPVSAAAVAEPPIDSVTLAADITIDKNTPGMQAPAFADVSGMTLSFVARKSTVLISLTASGYGFTNSMALLQIRVLDADTNAVIGGTMNKIQSFDDVTGTITTWSLAFSKPLTGLTINNTYNIKVQALATQISGSEDAIIDAATDPGSNHLTLTVFQ